MLKLSVHTVLTESEFQMVRAATAKAREVNNNDDDDCNNNDKNIVAAVVNITQWVKMEDRLTYCTHMLQQ